MSVFLVSFDLKNATSADYKKLYDSFDNFGNYCKLTSTTFILDADVDVDEIIDELSDKIGNSDTLFVIDLETLEIDGMNIPDCLEDFVASAGEMDEEGIDFGDSAPIE